MSDPRRVMKQLTALTARLPRKSQPSRPVFTAPGTDEQLSTAVAVYPRHRKTFCVSVRDVRTSSWCACRAWYP